ncbi:MAG: winged helix-turn-helix domain-containing protein [Acidobacteria bacterium]|nr:winged helix-turn-helix domain-containing protein [Acidobacteriota bacterium]
MTERESEMDIPELSDFRLGEWSVCRAEGTLSAGGHSVRLEPRVMDVLVFLAAQSGKVVSKDELLERVWGGTFVEEGVLSQAVHSLRKALGDDARQPRYIQTIPKRGYRLVASVSPAQSVGSAAALESSPPPRPEPERAVPVSLPRLRIARLVLLLLGMAAAAFWLAWNRFGTDRRTPEQHQTTEHGMRIVVLPFENLGKPGDEDAFFADGLTEEITKDLASLSSLQVISRTSAVRYQGAHRPLPEIGRELGVDYVLEGTVRWALGPEGLPRVRITPQLIRVADDTHVWAGSFDGQVKDIFAVQTEISRRVIGQLGISLLPEEKRTVQKPPTDNLEAYRAYIRGLELKNQPFYSEDHLFRAIPMFERAVRLDPGFAAAWAELSQTHSHLAFNTDSSPDRVEKSRQALARALEIDPDLLPVRLAQVYFTYRCLEDYATAQQQLTAAARRFPNNAELLESLGLVLRRRGRLTEAISSFRAAFGLNPREVRLPWWIAETYRASREYEQADHYFDQAISMAPDEAVYWAEKAQNRLAWTGDPDKARAVLTASPVAESPALAMVAFQLDLYQHDYKRALAQFTPETLKQLAPQVESRIAVLAVVARERLGDRNGALAAAEANRRLLEERVVRFPKEAFFRAYLAATLAHLDRGAEARAQVERAVGETSKDAFSGPRILEIQAMVDAILGRHSEAVAGLSRLLATPYQSSISVVDLRLNPVWDPLREDPGFVDLLRRFRG